MPVRPRLASAMLQETKTARFARKTSRKTTKGHFWQTFSSARLNAYGGGGGFLHRTGQGFLALAGAGGQVPHVARALVWFTRAISFTERIAFPATVTLTIAGDFARRGSLWRNGFSFHSLRNKWQMHIHTCRGKISLGQGDREVPRVLMCCRLLALSRVTMGSSAATGKLVTRGGSNCTSLLRDMFATGLLG